MGGADERIPLSRSRSTLSHSASFRESQALLWRQSQSPEKQQPKQRQKLGGNGIERNPRGKNRKRAHSVEPVLSNSIDLTQSDAEIEPEQNVEVDNCLPWYDKYAPRKLNEVAIHKRKLEDVENILEGMLSRDNVDDTRILLLTGPSGCSKSTTVKLLASELVPLYRNQRTNFHTLGLKAEDSNSLGDFIIEYESGSNLNGLGPMESFEEFIKRVKYRNNDSNLSVILVEDLPNVFHKGTRLAFQKILQEWLYVTDTRLPPLVICLTECEIEDDHSYSDFSKSININNTFTAETILNRDILENPKLKRIKFNPINMTLMKRTLNHISLMEKSLLQGQNKWTRRGKYIENLSRYGNGDIRSAISAFEFWANTNNGTYGNDSDTGTVEVKDIKGISNDDLFLRNTSISYFHALGRVIYGSQDIVDDNEMINTLIESDKGTLLEDNFKLGLLENYGSFNKSSFPIKLASAIVDSLSESDCFTNSPESLEYMIRKVRYMFNSFSADNSNNASSKNKSSLSHSGLMFPREWKCRKSQRIFGILGKDLMNVTFYKYNEPILMKDIITSLGYYSPLIRKQKSYKKKSLESYLNMITDLRERRQLEEKNAEILQVDDGIDILDRLGGDLKMIVDADNSIKSNEEVELSIEKSVYALEKHNSDKLKRLVLEKEKQELLNVDGSVEGGQGRYEKEYEMMMNDVLVDSDEDSGDKVEAPLKDSTALNGKRKRDIRGEDLEDDEDDSLLDMLSQQKPKKIIKHSESLSDSDLENL